MFSNIFITTIFILIGILLIKAAKAGYSPLFENWQSKLINKVAGEKGTVIFYYITGIVIIIIAIMRLVLIY